MFPERTIARKYPFPKQSSHDPKSRSDTKVLEVCSKDCLHILWLPREDNGPTHRHGRIRITNFIKSFHPTRQELFCFGHRYLLLEIAPPKNTFRLRQSRWFLTAMRFGKSMVLN
jgi:hypothetical protein